MGLRELKSESTLGYNLIVSIPHLRYHCRSYLYLHL